VRHSEACHSWWVDKTRNLQKGVTLNVAFARSAFCGFCEVVFRERPGVMVVAIGALSPLHHTNGSDARNDGSA